MSESLVERLVVLQGNQEIGGAVGVPGSAEDFVLVLPENLQPRAKVGSVAVRIVRDAALGHQKDARQFRTKLLLGVRRITKEVGLIERLPVETRFVATPVHFMPISA